MRKRPLYLLSSIIGKISGHNHLKLDPLVTKFYPNVGVVLIFHKVRVVDDCRRNTDRYLITATLKDTFKPIFNLCSILKTRTKMKYSEWYVPVVILCYSTDKNLSDKSEIQWL